MSEGETPNYYQILGLDPSERTPKNIKRAYRKEARRLHPDRGGDKEKMQALNQAYRTIKNPRSREDYDKKLGDEVYKPETPVGAGPPYDIREIWRGIFAESQEGFERDVQQMLDRAEGRRVLGISEFLGEEFLIPQEDEYLLWGMVFALKDNLGSLVIVDENDKPIWNLERIEDPEAFFQSLPVYIKSNYEGPTHFRIERNVVDFRKAKSGDVSPVTTRKYGFLRRDLNPAQFFTIDKIYQLYEDRQVIIPQALESHLGDLERMAINIVNLGKEEKPLAPPFYKDNIASLTQYVEINKSREGVLGAISRRKVGEVGIGLDFSRFRDHNGETKRQLK